MTIRKLLLYTKTAGWGQTPELHSLAAISYFLQPLVPLTLEPSDERFKAKSSLLFFFYTLLRILFYPLFLLLLLLLFLVVGRIFHVRLDWFYTYMGNYHFARASSHNWYFAVLRIKIHAFRFRRTLTLSSARASSKTIFPVHWIVLIFLPQESEVNGEPKTLTENVNIHRSAPPRVVPRLISSTPNKRPIYCTRV